MRNFKKLQRALDIGALSAPDIQDELEEIGEILLGLEKIGWALDVKKITGLIPEKTKETKYEIIKGFKRDHGKIYKMDLLVDDKKIIEEIFEHYEVDLQRGMDTRPAKDGIFVEGKLNSALRLQIKAWSGIECFEDPMDYNAITGELGGRK